ncbi:hypothetical protein [Falsiroseomonas tokyonensis]|uniref:Quinol:cytochrome c oxidoreductase quinone-binding subunit 2 n=1 Tax=Falsiroseomonas tokyonensis TaxID=430521 RepID=A0ABV7BRX2_9PROT|nr:hypothetical protein [Falsiroseomonas tokyonensis]MBU8537179.1 hypothetical protein [Falsiroseomonas tokyonensis]
MKWLLALALGAVALAVSFAGSAALLEAWLTGFLLWLHLGVGAIGVLALGHLLREEWLAPVRAPLEAAARSLPLLALMALPLLLVPDQLYPWAHVEAEPGPRAALLQPWAFRLRSLAYLLVWAALGWRLARPGPQRGASVLALVLLLPTATLAGFDWVLSRDTSWYASLQGFSMWVAGLAAALAAAILAARTHPSSEGLPGLERALLTLGLAVLWLWFTQFIVVWMADLPEEAGWYLRRLGEWRWVQLGLALPALLLAIALAAPPDHGRWRMVAVCWLLLVQFAAHLWWVVRPDAPLATPAPWLDLLVTGGLGLAFALWWRAGLRRLS